MWQFLCESDDALGALERIWQQHPNVVATPQHCNGGTFLVPGTSRQTTPKKFQQTARAFVTEKYSSLVANLVRLIWEASNERPLTRGALSEPFGL